MIRLGLITGTIGRRVEPDLIAKLEFNSWMKTLLQIFYPYH